MFTNLFLPRFIYLFSIIHVSLPMALSNAHRLPDYGNICRQFATRGDDSVIQPSRMLFLSGELRDGSSENCSRPIQNSLVNVTLLRGFMTTGVTPSSVKEAKDEVVCDGVLSTDSEGGIWIAAYLPEVVDGEPMWFQNKLDRIQICIDGYSCASYVLTESTAAGGKTPDDGKQSQDGGVRFQDGGRQFQDDRNHADSEIRIRQEMVGRRIVYFTKNLFCLNVRTDFNSSTGDINAALTKNDMNHVTLKSGDAGRNIELRGGTLHTVKKREYGSMEPGFEPSPGENHADKTNDKNSKESPNTDLSRNVGGSKTDWMARNSGRSQVGDWPHRGVNMKHIELNVSGDKGRGRFGNDRNSVKKNSEGDAMKEGNGGVGWGKFNHLDLERGKQDEEIIKRISGGRQWGVASKFRGSKRNGGEREWGDADMGFIKRNGDDRQWGDADMGWIKRNGGEREWGDADMGFIKRNGDDRQWGDADMGWIKRNGGEREWGDADMGFIKKNEDDRQWGDADMGWIKRNGGERDWGDADMGFIKRNGDDRQWGDADMGWIKRNGGKRDWGDADMGFIKRNVDDRQWGDADMGWIKRNGGEREWGDADMGFIRRNGDDRQWGDADMGWIKRNGGERDWGDADMGFIKRNSDDRQWGDADMGWIKRNGGERDWGDADMGFIKRNGDDRQWGDADMGWIKRNGGGREWRDADIDFIKRDVDSGLGRYRSHAAGMKLSDPENNVLKSGRTPRTVFDTNVKLNKKLNNNRKWGGADTFWVKRKFDTNGLIAKERLDKNLGGKQEYVGYTIFDKISPSGSRQTELFQRKFVPITEHISGLNPAEDKISGKNNPELNAKNF